MSGGSTIRRAFDAAWPSIAVLAAGVGLLLLDPLIVEGHDEQVYHLPAIRGFAADLPWVDLRDYSAAMTPLYHLIIAAALRAGVDELFWLRFISLLISAAGVAALRWFFAGFLSPARASLFAAVIGLSPYYLGPALFLASDNMAFASMALTMALLVRAPERPRVGMTAAVVTVAVLTRQLYAWLVPLWAVFGGWQRRDRRRWLWLALPLAALGVFVVLWGGLVPPSSVRMHQEPAGLLPALAVLATLGIWSVPLIPALSRGALSRRVVLWSALLTLLAGAYLWWSPITAAHPAPWGGGMRRLGTYTGSVAGTPLLYWAGLVAGAFALPLLLSRVETRAQRITVVAFVLWMLAQQLNAAMLERYYQPFVLLVLFSCAGRDDRRTTIGASLLAGMVLAASVVRFLVHGAGLMRF